MDGGRAGLQFSARIFVNPDFIADGHWTISRGAAPIALPTGLQGNGTINIADARDARGWILFFIRSRLRGYNTQKSGQTQQQSQPAFTGKCLHDEPSVLRPDRQPIRVDSGECSGGWERNTFGLP